MRDVAAYLRSYRRLRTGGVTRRSLICYPWRRRFGQRCNRLDLRTGESLVSPVNEQLLTMFEEVWVDELYAPDGWRPPSGGLVIDIGANVGVFATWAVRRAGAARVLAFEPTPSTVAVLERNVARNDLSAVTVFAGAVGRRRGRVPVYQRGPSSMNTVFSTDILGSHFEQVAVVDVVTLDDVFEQFGVDRCDLLKLDCEGSEYDILAGAKPATLAKVETVVAEYHVGLNDGDPAVLGALLERSGFQVTIHGMVDAEGGHLHAVRVQ